MPVTDCLLIPSPIACSGAGLHAMVGDRIGLKDSFKKQEQSCVLFLKGGNIGTFVTSEQNVVCVFFLAYKGIKIVTDNELAEITVCNSSD